MSLFAPVQRPEMTFRGLMNFARRGAGRLRRETLCAIHRRGLALNDNDRRIAALRGRHAGETVFILGNGPSLKVPDLNLLKGRVTMASNKIYLAFDQTEWRPTYYFVTDRLVAKNNTDKISELSLTKLFSNDIRHFFPKPVDAIWLREEFRNSVWLEEAGGRANARGFFSTDLLVEVIAGWTVIYTQLQAAHYMGASRVVLLGVDFSFNVPPKRVATKEHGYETAVESTGEVNHFHPDYRKPGESWSVPDLEMQHRAFSLARDVFRESGREVLNASRVTKLDVFPRATLEEILAETR
jgi:hypothetical protein